VSRTLRSLVLRVATATAVIAEFRHVRRMAGGHQTPGGILIRNAAGYDLFSRWLLGSLFTGVADDIATLASEGTHILEVGCGPGHLSIQLARRGLEVTGIDLDPAMIEQASTNAADLARHDGRRPIFQVADVARLPFPDATFDLVVSTLSMHHWDDPTTGLTEISRVLRPNAQSLIWDFQPGMFHSRAPDPKRAAADTPLHVISTTPWRWPWKLSLLQRTALARNAARRVTT